MKWEIGARVLAWRLASRGYAPATVVMHYPSNGSSRLDTGIKYDDDPQTYRTWSQSLKPAPRDVRPADAIAPMLHLPAECDCCGDVPRQGSLYCSDRCRRIVEGIPSAQEYARF